ncbi:hypothetical protein V5O48_001467 [Marasmius crinis-equi]|uniref:Uncharacterized protein n=1 Tax=Marasmius crinis-equi TaxID=585013 RepID=A0ABR3FYV9_9AGAR
MALIPPTPEPNRTRFTAHTTSNATPASHHVPEAETSPSLPNPHANTSIHHQSPETQSLLTNPFDDIPEEEESFLANPHDTGTTQFPTPPYVQTTPATSQSPRLLPQHLPRLVIPAPRVSTISQPRQVAPKPVPHYHPTATSVQSHKPDSVGVVPGHESAVSSPDSYSAYSQTSAATQLHHALLELGDESIPPVPPLPPNITPAPLHLPSSESTPPIPPLPPNITPAPIFLPGYEADTSDFRLHPNVPPTAISLPLHIPLPDLPPSHPEPEPETDLQRAPTSVISNLLKSRGANRARMPTIGLGGGDQNLSEAVEHIERMGSIISYRGGGTQKRKDYLGEKKLKGMRPVEEYDSEGFEDEDDYEADEVGLLDESSNAQGAESTHLNPRVLSYYESESQVSLETVKPLRISRSK